MQFGTPKFDNDFSLHRTPKVAHDQEIMICHCSSPGYFHTIYPIIAVWVGGNV